MASLLNNASLLFNPAGSIISYQEDKIYSVLPKDGTGDFTFSGGDGGTRVNQQGYIEVTPANLINQSEAIGSSPWILNDTSLTANSTAAPNGTTTADTIANNGNNAAHRVYQGPFTGYGSPQTMSFSLYVKYNNHQYFSFGLTDDSVYRSQVVVDLVNGTITQNFVNTGGDTLTSTITNVGGGWYYVTGTFTYATSLIGFNAYFLCMLLNQSTFTSAGYVGTGTSVFVWGAMFNTGGVKPYQPTTDRLNYPRITYQNGRGALLSEPQRTNLITYSQQFDNAAWEKAVATVTANTTISPDGTQNADTITCNGTGYQYVRQSIFGGTNQSCACSVYVKRGSARYFAFRNSGNTSNHDVFDFDSSAWVTNNTGATLSYEVLKDGWFRLMSVNSNVNNYYWSCFPTDSTSGAEVTTSSNLTVYVWGGQGEQNATYVSSYIPTTSATVTRPTDKAFRYSATSLIGQSEGTVYFDFTLDNLCDGLQTNQPVLWYMKDGGTGERYVELISGNKLVYIEYNGAVIANIQTSAITAGRHKCAIAYANNDMVFYVDGVQIGTDTSGTPSGFSTVSTQYYNSFFDGQCKAHSLAPYTSRLSNTQLAELTTVRSGSGGTISYYGPYTIHTFTGSATFTPSFTGPVEVLVVAGGGAGGGGDVGGGGGAGGLLYVSSYGVSQGTGITVTVGAGGTGVAIAGAAGGNGSNSVFGGLTAIGGGGGAGWTKGTGNDGGSGGGATFYGVGGKGIPGQGNDGGTGGVAGTPYPQCGGGGAGQIGLPATGSTIAGNGGAGLPYSISGFSTYYAGGGGGATEGTVGTPGTPGTGGLGGGGNGGSQGASILGTPGVNGLGGGGGGCDPQAGANGGSGIVIVRYLT